MTKRKNLSLLEKEKKIVEKIERAKANLKKLRDRRIAECGQLIVKHGLDQYEPTTLNEAFAQLAEKLNNGSQQAG